MQRWKLSGQRTYFNCPWWIRTTITGSKDRCPAIGRRGSGNGKLVQKLHGDNALGGASDNPFRPLGNLERRNLCFRVGGSGCDPRDLEHRRSRAAHSVELTVPLPAGQQRIDLRVSLPHHRLEVVDRVSGG